MTVFLVQGHNLVSCGLYFKLIKKKLLNLKVQKNFSLKIRNFFTNRNVVSQIRQSLWNLHWLCESSGVSLLPSRASTRWTPDRMPLKSSGGRTDRSSQSPLIQTSMLLYLRFHQNASKSLSLNCRTWSLFKHSWTLLTINVLGTW